MFAVFTVRQPSRKPLLKKWWSNIFGVALRYELTELGKVKYVTIAWEEQKRPISWKSVASLAGGEAKSLVLPKEIELPENAPVERFDSMPFVKSIMQGSLLDVIERAKLYEKGVKIGLYDPRGEHAEFLQLLLPVAYGVKVLTENPGSFDRIRQSELVKADLEFTPDAGELGDCPVIVAPDALRGELPLDDRQIVFSFERASSDCRCLVIDDCEIGISRDLAALCPEGIDPNDFLAALYEKCGIHNLSNSTVSHFISNRKEKFLRREMIRMLSAIDTDG